MGLEGGGSQTGNVPGFNEKKEKEREKKDDLEKKIRANQNGNVALGKKCRFAKEGSGIKSKREMVGPKKENLLNSLVSLGEVSEKKRTASRGQRRFKGGKSLLPNFD